VLLGYLKRERGGKALLGLIISAFFLILPAVLYAELPIPPIARVLDQSGTLSSTQIAELDQKLGNFEKQKGAQIAVLIVRSTQPESIEQYSIRVAEKWKLGRKGVDDGVLLLIAKEDRALKIEVGYGLEGALTDLISRRIGDQIITPQFRSGDFYGGVSAGVDALISVISGEALPAPKSDVGPKIGDSIFGLFALGMIAGSLLRQFFSKGVASLVSGLGLGLIAWAFYGLLVGMLFGIFFALLAYGALENYSGYYGGGGYSGGGSGSFGGGFSGGGGSFGGGGATSRW